MARREARGACHLAAHLKIVTPLIISIFYLLESYSYERGVEHTLLPDSVTIQFPSRIEATTEPYSSRCSTACRGIGNVTQLVRYRHPPRFAHGKSSNNLGIAGLHEFLVSRSDQNP